MDVIIFGGSFNPPTRAHEAIIAACLALPQFDEVWVMPSGSRADKIINTTDTDRLAMLDIIKKEVFADNPRLVISRFELGLPRPTRLHRTAAALSQNYPQTNFWFAFGGDAYVAMHTWYKADEFISSLNLVVFTDRPVPETKSGRAIHLQIATRFQNISSTQARHLIATSGDSSHIVSPSVAQYLQTHMLYKKMQ